MIIVEWGEVWNALAPILNALRSKLDYVFPTPLFSYQRRRQGSWKMDRPDRKDFADYAEYKRAYDCRRGRNRQDGQIARQYAVNCEAV
jgi:hypothetical protein